MSDLDVIAAMESFGGSFVRSLAQAFRLADADNRERIKTAFPEVWEKYSLWAAAEKIECNAK